ncbi:MAG: sulfotransferase [Phycisphaeraceae bacterium]
MAVKTATAVRVDPFFVIGYKRSGTTMTRLMLNAHPDLAVPPESEYFLRIPQAIGNRRHGADDLEKLTRRISQLPRSNFKNQLDEDAVRDALHAVLPADTPTIVACLYQQWATIIGKPHARWGDKKPHHWQYIYKLSSLYPASQYIHIMRDPRDVVASVEEHFPEQVRGRGVLPSHIITAWQWRLANLETLRCGESLGPERYMRARYEDTVSEPEQHARNFCDFLNVDFNDAMLEFHQSASDPRIEGAKTSSGPHQNTTRQVHTERIGRSQSSLEPAALADIEFIAGDLFARFGWDRQHDVTRSRGVYLRGVCTALNQAWNVLRASRRLRGGY